MRKILAVCGRPGTGKTTLFREFLKIGTWEKKELVKTVNSLYNETLDLHVLGKYEDDVVFAGTDRLSMSVMPEVKKFLSECDSNILFEGDRLTSSNFFDYLNELPDSVFKIFLLEASDKTLTYRYVERGSTQSEQFLKGRITKLNNIGTNMNLIETIEYFNNETLKDQKIILENIKKFLET